MSDEGRGVRRTGIGMLLLFWLLFIAAGTWWFHGYVERQRNPNSHLAGAVGEGEPLVLERSRGGHFVATGRINGEPVEFLVDTGATYVALPREMAERLGVEPSGGAWFNTANGRVRGELTTLDEVSLGGYVARDVRGSISSGLEGDTALLGMSFLNHFDIRIRDARMELIPDAD